MPWLNSLTEHEISIHALRVEGDRYLQLNPIAAMQFLSTPSGWRATVIDFCEVLEYNGFLSTPSGWRATKHFFAVP